MYFKSNVKAEAKKKKKVILLLKYLVAFAYSGLSVSDGDDFFKTTKQNKKNHISLSPSWLFQMTDCVRFLTPRCCIDFPYFRWGAQMSSTHSLNQPDRLMKICLRAINPKGSVFTPERLTPHLVGGGGALNMVLHRRPFQTPGFLWETCAWACCSLCHKYSLFQTFSIKETHTHTHYTTWTLGQNAKVLEECNPLTLVGWLTSTWRLDSLHRKRKPE